MRSRANWHTIPGPQSQGFRVQPKIDYEIEEYELYSTIAHSLLDIGLAAEARVFESLADLCFEKAEMIAKINRIQEHLQRRSSSRNNPK